MPARPCRHLARHPRAATAAAAASDAQKHKNKNTRTSTAPQLPHSRAAQALRQRAATAFAPENSSGAARKSASESMTGHPQPAPPRPRPAIAPGADPLSAGREVRRGGVGCGERMPGAGQLSSGRCQERGSRPTAPRRRQNKAWLGRSRRAPNAFRLPMGYGKWTCYLSSSTLAVSGKPRGHHVLAKGSKCNSHKSAIKASNSSTREARSCLVWRNSSLDPIRLLYSRRELHRFGMLCCMCGDRRNSFARAARRRF